MDALFFDLGSSGDGGTISVSGENAPEKSTAEMTEFLKTYIHLPLNNGLKNGKTNDVTDLDDATHLGECGIGSCNPRWMQQKCRSIGCFTAVYGLSAIMTSALTTYIGSQVTTLEKHFNFNSSVSGILIACNDFGYFLTCVFLSYLSRRVHIPRCLMISCVAFGVSGLMCTIPYFGTRDVLLHNAQLSGGVNSSNENVFGQLCVKDSDVINPTDNSTTSCHGGSQASGSGSSSGGIYGVSDQWRTLAITLIGLGMILQGVAKSPTQSFVSVYIDDNVPKTKTSLYLGMVYGLSIFGPSIAYLTGGLASSLYITLEDTNLTSEDPRWLGAWWLGFLLFGSLNLVVGIPLLFFPKRIILKPEVELIEMKRKLEGQGQNKAVVEIKGFCNHLKILVKNPVYMLLTLGSSLNIMCVSGAMAFQPKFLEEYFNLPTWMVNIVLGAMTVGGACIGSIAGGVVTSKYRLSPRTCLKVMIVFTFVSLGIFMGVFALHCDQPTIYSGDDGNLQSSSNTCGTSCGCKDTSFFPVCGEDGRNYFSPCHAGCTNIFDDGKKYINCGCLSTPESSEAKGGICNSECGTNFWIYSSLGFFSSVAMTFTFMQNFIATIRSVPEEQKPLAVGVTSFLTTLIGWFPGPILFGVIVDSTCLITQSSTSSSLSPSSSSSSSSSLSSSLLSSSCGESDDQDGACLLYDLQAFRNKYHGVAAGLRVVSLLLYCLAFLYVKCSSKTVFYAHDDDDVVHEKRYDDDDEKRDGEATKNNNNNNNNGDDKPGRDNNKTQPPQ